MKKYLTEGVLLAGVPLLAYMYTYAFNAGYGSFFNLPLELISFSLPSLFSTLPALLFGLFIAFQVFNGFSPGRPENKINLLGQNVMIVLALWAAMTVVKAPVLPTTGFLGVALIFIMLHFVYPLVEFRRVEGYENKVEAHIAKKESTQGTIGDFLYNSPMRKGFDIFALFTGSLILAFFVGLRHANTQEKYYVLTSDQKWVVVRLLDDKAVLTKTRGNQLTNGVKVVSISSDVSTAPEFSLKKTGQLHR